MAIIRAYIEAPFTAQQDARGAQFWGVDLSGIPEALGYSVVAADRTGETCVVLVVIDGVTRKHLETPRGYHVYGLDELDAQNRRARIPDEVRNAVISRATNLGRSAITLERSDIDPPGIEHY